MWISEWQIKWKEKKIQVKTQNGILIGKKDYKEKETLKWYLVNKWWGIWEKELRKNKKKIKMFAESIRAA